MQIHTANLYEMFMLCENVLIYQYLFNVFKRVEGIHTPPKHKFKLRAL